MFPSSAWMTRWTPHPDMYASWYSFFNIPLFLLLKQSFLLPFFSMRTFSSFPWPMTLFFLPSSFLLLLLLLLLLLSPFSRLFFCFFAFLFCIAFICCTSVQYRSLTFSLKLKKSTKSTIQVAYLFLSSKKSTKKRKHS